MIAQLVALIKLDLRLEQIVNWLSPIGPMNFTFSTNIAKEKTDKTESFNFSLGTTFYDHI